MLVEASPVWASAFLLYFHSGVIVSVVLVRPARYLRRGLVSFYAAMLVAVSREAEQVLKQVALASKKLWYHCW